MAEQTYSCQNCGRWFESGQDHKIEVGFCPVCSNKCGFMIIYNFIKKQRFDDETLNLMLKNIGKEQKTTSFKRNDALYEIAKFYNSKGLSNIKFVLGKGQAFVPMDKNLSEGTKGQDIPPYIIGGMSQSLSHVLPNGQNRVLSHHSKKGDLTKWF